MAVSAAIIRFPMPFIYVLQCRDGSLYTGIAKEEYRIKHMPRAAKLALVRSGVRSARRGR
ncbi:MAG: hypothetical protein HYW08_05065 [candidate division NC10 bacterium]|nr:hypothetical protein [candidate division NC10 bacterium]